MSKQTRIARYVKFYDYMWKFSPYKIAFFYFLLLGIMSLIAALLIQIFTDDKPDADDLSGLGAIALVVGTYAVGTIFLGYIIAYTRNHVVKPRLERFKISYKEYIEIQFYLNIGSLPPNKIKHVDYRAIIEDKIALIRKNNVWVPLLLFFFAGMQFLQAHNNEGNRTISLFLGIILISIAILQPFLIKYKTTPKLKALLNTL